MKQYIPQGIKRSYRLSTRWLNDLTKGYNRQFASTDREKVPYNGMIETRQTMRNSESAEAKIHNIKIATKEIAKCQILPDEIFSFWKWVGKPSKGKGYQEGRNLVAGELTKSIGGGLCQLSGIMYHTALKAGLEIVERHAHSQDIYQEDERYTPLGADAAVVYGYKDLRIRNSRGFPIKYTFMVNDDDLICRLFLEENIFTHTIQFNRENKEGKEFITTILIDPDGNKTDLGISEYLRCNQ
ncbi:MAG: VanW family protein [Saprospiraceae bacterium]